MVVHNHSGDNAATFQPSLWQNRENPPWVNEDGAEDEKLKLCYDSHKHLILKRRKLI